MLVCLNILLHSIEDYNFDEYTYDNGKTEQSIGSSSDTNMQSDGDDGWQYNYHRFIYL